jgi:hypothetical protein
VSEVKKSSPRPFSERFAVVFGAMTFLFLLLLIFVSDNDATVVMFVGYSAMFAATLMYALLRRTAIGPVARALLVIAAPVVAGVLASLLTSALQP